MAHRDFATLQSFVEAGVVEPFIRSVRFPRFKNLREGSEIDFLYPLTALIGPNGTNKSTILRALQGSPNQYDIGDYWFDTPLDPLGDEKGNPHRFIHSYRVPSGVIAEVIKARVGKTSRGADYFETSAPRTRDGMTKMPDPGDPADAKFRNKTRWRPIEKDVVYLDFRQEIPAYDILMHFSWRKQLKQPGAKKRRIRSRAPHVEAALNGLESEHKLYGSNRILEPADELTRDELEALSRILQRRYSSVRIVKHDLFNVEGYTASLASDGRTYSEAYAGSGEFAAIMLVRSISRANPRSLILLDEPETSLHPGAQRELMRFLASECVKNKHQVVLATHAPAMVEELPDIGRKLLDLDASSSKVRVVAQSSTTAQAFSRVGGRFDARTVVVEDGLARELVTRAARIRGIDFLNSFSVFSVPGGAEALIQRVVAVQAALGSDCVVLLDGDCRPTDAVLAPEQVSDAQLQAELNKIGLRSEVLLRNGGRGEQAGHLAHVRRQALEWATSHVGYLPTSHNPEALLLDMIEAAHSGNADAKSQWCERTRASLGLLDGETVSSGQILAEQVRVLAVVSDTNPLLQEVLGVLDELLAVA